MTNELNRSPPTAESIIAMAERINRLQSTNRELLEALDDTNEVLRAVSEALPKDNMQEFNRLQHLLHRNLKAIAKARGQ